MKRHVLKAVVKHDAIDRISAQHPTTECHPISTDRNNGLRTPLGNQERFIPRL
jgi:hypothetical protein